jgi:dTDP-glucose pyrophosphorylase/CBS domain-containing protein
MKNVKDIIVNTETLLKEALKIINESSKQICLVLNDNNKLIGTVNDGDIRRALLNNVSLNDTIKNIYFKNPTVVNVNDSKKTILNICKIKKIHQIPVVDDENTIVGLEILDDLIGTSIKSNKVILMVGGLGARLRPLTENTPKPMLFVGGRPILQTIVEKFVSYGFINIIMCIGYKSYVIHDFFENGSKFGANIEYIYENKRMGTVGALSLLSSKQKPTEPFFVMNGDLLTNINFEHMMEYHLSNNSIATMGVREYDFQVPYGVVNVDDGNILSIEEKPVHKFFVNGGIYVLNNKVLDFIPNDEFYDMPTLFEKLIEKKLKSISFPIHEYWLDIGRIEEFEKANNEFHEVFN